MAILRSALATDLTAIFTLLRDSSLPATDFEEHLRAFTVAETEGKIVGCVGLEILGTEALLRSLAVAPGQRTRGLGSELLAAAVRCAKGAGVTRLFLLTTTAAAFFQRHEFQAQERDAVPHSIAQTLEFRSLCPSTATCLRLDLG